MAKLVEWNAAAASDALEVLRHRSLEALEWTFGDGMAAVSGCLRGLFVASPGHDLICSDYSAIEAVGVAELAGCEWRREVFRTHGKIYEESASRAFSVPLDDILEYKQRTKEHHPLRKKGKVLELACGYQGWLGAARAFGMPGTDDEVTQAILDWRAASPEIPDLWGGQPSWRRNEYWGVEGAAILAVQNPGQVQYPLLRSPTADAARMAHIYDPAQDILFVQLLSGRWMRYHRPRLEPSVRRIGELSLSYEGQNTNPKKGPMGWIRISTFGGRLVENYTQATCRDIMTHAAVNLERSGYPVVLHVYDELVSEVPQGFGSVEEFERIMVALPDWCARWPVRATGGWRGQRYRKG